MGKTYKKNEFDKIEKFKKLKNGHKGKNTVRQLEEKYIKNDYPDTGFVDIELDWFGKGYLSLTQEQEYN